MEKLEFQQVTRLDVHTVFQSDFIPPHFRFHDNISHEFTYKRRKTILILRAKVKTFSCYDLSIRDNRVEGFTIFSLKLRKSSFHAVKFY